MAKEKTKTTTKKESDPVIYLLMNLNLPAECDPEIKI